MGADGPQPAEKKSQSRRVLIEEQQIEKFPKRKSSQVETSQVQKFLEIVCTHGVCIRFLRKGSGMKIRHKREPKKERNVHC